DPAPGHVRSPPRAAGPRLDDRHRRRDEPLTGSGRGWHHDRSRRRAARRVPRPRGVDHIADHLKMRRRMAADVEATAALSSRRERVGWSLYDWANSAFSTTVVTVFLGPYLGAIADNAADAHGRVYPLGIPVAAGSLFAYTVSLSVFLQVFVLPTVGAVADRSSHKKQLLALVAYIGSGATMGLGFLTRHRDLLGAALFLVATTAFGASHVVYSLHLP